MKKKEKVNSYTEWKIAPELEEKIIQETKTVAPMKKKVSTQREVPTPEVTELKVSEQEVVSVAETDPDLEDISILDAVLEPENISILDDTPDLEDISILDTAPKSEDISILDTAPKPEDISILDTAPKPKDISILDAVPKPEDILILEATPESEDNAMLEDLSVLEMDNLLSVDTTEDMHNNTYLSYNAIKEDESSNTLSLNSLNENIEDLNNATQLSGNISNSQHDIEQFLNKENVVDNSYFDKKEENSFISTSTQSTNLIQELSEEEQLKILFERLDLSENIRRMNASAQEDMAEIIEKSTISNELELEMELPAEDMTVVKNDDGFFVATSESESISKLETTQNLDFFDEKITEKIDDKAEEASLISIDTLITDEPAPAVFDAGIVTPVSEKVSLIIEPSPFQQNNEEEVVEVKPEMNFEEKPEEKPQLTINTLPKQVTSSKQVKPKEQPRKPPIEKVVKNVGVGKRIYHKMKLK